MKGGLSTDQIASLLNAPKRSQAQAKPNALVRIDGKLTPMSISPTYFGKFEGKAGSLRRSSSGNITRALNGRRAYVRNTEMEVVAYSA